MPAESTKGTLHQPYAASMSWSRRFSGLKVFLALATAGENGYRETLRHQIAMGTALREKLRVAGWRLLNETPLPVVCFSDDKNSNVEAMAHFVGASGKSWVTTVELSGKGPALRAGIANFATKEEHLDTLVSVLDEARKKTADAL